MKLKIPVNSAAILILSTTTGDWTLYELPHDEARDSFLWLRFKFMLPPETPQKWGLVRGYDLRWNPVELRMGKMRSKHLLETAHPALYERIDLWLSLNRDSAWLERVMGVTAVEIQAERRRLAEIAKGRRAEKRAAAALR